MALGFIKDSEDRSTSLAGYLKVHAAVNTLIAGVGLTHELRREAVSGIVVNRDSTELCI